MSPGDSLGISARLDAVFRAESGRILATLIAILRDFDLAEESLQEACKAALRAWERGGVPANPRAWLVQAARHKAIDRIRRDANLARKLEALPRRSEQAPSIEAQLRAEGPLADDRLRLLFTCCHPALAPEAQVALSLHTLCGLTTEEIARAFLLTPATLAQRLVRAKRKIRAARIPYRVPEEQELPERLAAVLRTVYLVFNEGYSATSGDQLLRVDLCREAIRLARLVVALLPARSEAIGLLALLLLTDARRSARVDANGDLVLLADQERTKWDRAEMQEGLAMSEEALRLAREPGPLALQAAIAASHAKAPTAKDTDWRVILSLYDSLVELEPTPVVRLNRAVALAEAQGAGRSLPVVESLAAEGDLSRYHLLHATYGELLARLGRTAEAVRSLQQARELAPTVPERRFLTRRIGELSSGAATAVRVEDQRPA